MAAIKFSKQSIQPNPMEVDYWVDITSNPYGGNIKYYNGYDWVDLLNAKGKPVNLDAYYNKLQMNQMLAGKASVESVNSKVDDTEVADVIKNIEFKDRGDEGVEMVVLKYDGMTVGVTLPTASNTTSGIVTNKSFKDLVKQNQLQGVYSEMYDKLSEIRQQYQRKLKAGKNIQIDENNTIHAVGEISLDWNDVYNKPDFDKLFATVALAIQSESNRAKAAEQQLSARITDHVDVVEGKLELKADANNVYTKDQIDEKISGIYKIKGSRTFQDLPTSGNSIGDVYNITNDFALDGVEYPLGTNVVYTATGWDALAGIFDSTEIENKVDEIDTELVEEVIRAKEKELELDRKFYHYLPLSGGIITGTLDIANSNTSVIRFRNLSDKIIGYLGVTTTQQPVFFNSSGINNKSIILHEQNYSDYALPLTGGTVTGKTYFYTKDSAPVIVSSNSTNTAIAFKNSDTVDYAYLYYGPEGFIVTDDGWHNAYKIYHEGNFNPDDYLLRTGGIIEGDINVSTVRCNLYVTRDGAGLLALNPIGWTGSTGEQWVIGDYRYGGLIRSVGNLLHFDGSNTYKIWDEGNDGEGSGLDADTIHGINGKYLAVFDPTIDANDTAKHRHIGYGYAEKGWFGHGPALSFGANQSYYAQMLVEYDNSRLVVRTYNFDKYTDWKTIAFTDYNGFHTLYGGKQIPNGSDLNDYKTVGTYNVLQNTDATTIINCPITEAFVLKVSLPTGTAAYIKLEVTGWNSFITKSRIYVISTSSWSEWATTSTKLDKYNAPTATKLATARHIWGQSFDGSNRISGNLYLTTPDATSVNNNSAVLRFNGVFDPSANYIQGPSIRSISSGGSHGRHRLSIHQHDADDYTTENEVMTILPNGFVGIGTVAPSSLLLVMGTVRASNGFLTENNYAIKSFDNSGNALSILELSNNNNLYVGYSTAPLGYSTYIQGSRLVFTYGKDKTPGMILNQSGDVGIGTTDPQYTLDVNGLCRVKRSIIINNNEAFLTFDAAGHMLPVMQLNANDNLRIGSGTASYGHNTYVSGNNLILTYGTSNTTGMILNQSGNVTIGESDLAGSNYKLYVDGNTFIKTKYTQTEFGQTYIHFFNSYNRGGFNIYPGTNTSSLALDTVDENGHWYANCFNASKNGNVSFAHTVEIEDNLNVKNYILGDLVDWYGVSWSEDSSDPTCTRIGNMALHRSLPILSAMKGYVILNNYDSSKDLTILDILDSWEKTKFGALDNGNTYLKQLGLYGNVMTKIPEFWYIDDYEPDTKTHNLKISQTAKAGWCHHKEAYVGSYEGYDQGTYYMSTKDVVPTVSVTRETIRTKARANGYDDEYKWNIYTYEEHRAICHLFLVEYATRNSQLAVNTALTSDGFKQGGLGSGCTTGPVTINGQTTYSFIPTGTTDSLGNGSGQVAYTVTQTDADGNEIGTVTRYANRYRGIENPFGHIWKHVDDIVNVYNAETTYKTIYKCNKPEHFATNKNAKYKPLCSFPGGSKMQGWSKEIKATINCDFFKYSVGGSESTYWCDYNYDNDDTSEHCLLIGGDSGNGGWAGLFRFCLDDGVGASYVSVGSRLTYLPWAE